MEVDECSSNGHNATITSQKDVDRMQSSLCQGNVFIQNATGTLSFTDLTQVTAIYVEDSPQLEVLDFPVLEKMSELNIIQAQSLTNLSLPRLKDWRTQDGGMIITSVIINGAPSLLNFDLGNLEDVWNYTIFGLPTDVPLTLDRVYGGPQIVSAQHITTDDCPILSNLSYAGYVHISPLGPCSLVFHELTAAEDITLDNVDSFTLTSPLAVNGSFTLANSTADTNRSSSDVLLRFPEMTIGSSISITSNSNSTLDLGGLKTVSGDIVVVNNTNCALNFDNLTDAGNITVLDNIGTALPIFPKLERVGDINLRGDIDPSARRNIFPSLQVASGSVIVEPWNDFNCSRLQTLDDEGVIASLTCSGTNNGTDVDGEAALSAGAWDGIGVGIAVVFIGLITTFTWVVLYLRRMVKRMQALSEVQQPDEKSHAASQQGSMLDQLQQLGGQGTVREKPDDHLCEMYALPAEKPDDQIHELPAGPSGTSNSITQAVDGNIVQ